MFSPYGKYKHTRNAAWQCLLDNQVTALPVSVSSIARRNHIRLGTYSKNITLIERLGLGALLQNDGFSTLTSTGFVILYRDDLDPRVSRFTIAHEFGHIFLGHLFFPINGTPCTTSNPTKNPRDDPLEQEANGFAARLLAPSCVLSELGIRSLKEISVLCNISTEAAKLCAQSTVPWCESNGAFLAAESLSDVLPSSLERRVCDNFCKFISTHKNNPLK